MFITCGGYLLPVEDNILITCEDNMFITCGG